MLCDKLEERVNIFFFNKWLTTNKEGTNERKKINSEKHLKLVHRARIYKETCVYIYLFSIQWRNGKKGDAGKQQVSNNQFHCIRQFVIFIHFPTCEAHATTTTAVAAWWWWWQWWTNEFAHFILYVCVCAFVLNMHGKDNWRQEESARERSPMVIIQQWHFPSSHLYLFISFTFWQWFNLGEELDENDHFWVWLENE